MALRSRIGSTGALAWVVAAGATAFACGGCGAGQPTALQRATSLAHEHREGDAIRVLRDELARHPDDVKSQRLLIRVLALTGDLGAARQEVEALSRKLGSADPLPSIELGHAYELVHEYEKALEMYDYAGEMAPADARGPREGGMRAAHWGEVEWARPRLEEAMRRGTNDAPAWHALGLLRIHAGDLDGAEKAYRAGLVADGKAAECHLGLATVAALRGDGASALLEYDAIIGQRPRFAPAHVGRAWALGRLGRKAEAREALVTAEKLGGEPRGIADVRRSLEVTESGPPSSTPSTTTK
ncbi:MAG TPA: tetratricopeptide repeat protein [Polyangiaceae bacterium]|nr:tetratricopeptide repeat protein [Polyangiaceae bacterium]